MKISILIPVFDEKKTVLDVIDLVDNLDIDKEIIIVDDCSTDGTREILKQMIRTRVGGIKIFFHDKNQGKGGAIKTALEQASGDYVIVQDADMEYSPHEIIKLVDFADKTGAEAVYGSRFLETWKSTTFIHYCINWFLTSLTNVLFNAGLTDMETCYKMIKRDLIQSLGIRARKFEFEPEVTVKILKKGVKIYEVPISYRGRGYDEGKKITWRDGVEAVIALLKLRFSN